MNLHTCGHDIAATSLKRCPRTRVLADRHERAGPAFFARHAIADLQTWSEQDLTNLGPLPFPMTSEKQDTHFHSLGWSSVLLAFCDALTADARSVSIVTTRCWENEAAGIASTLRRSISADVEQVRSDALPSRPFSEKHASRRPVAEGRIVLVIGDVHASAWCFDSPPALLVLMCERVSGSMLWPAQTSLVLPITSVGWLPPPHLFRRMLDFKIEQLTTPDYSEVVSLIPPLSRPLCSIIAEIVKRVRCLAAE